MATLRFRTWAAALALAAAGLALTGRAAHADDIIHTVQPGENLYRIGLQHGVSWIDIQRANKLPSTLIYVGQQLIIPVSGPAPTATPPEATGAEPTPTPQPAPAPEPGAASTYVVQPGDTLSRIAQRFGVTTAALVTANQIANPSLIYAGQVLTIPAGGTDTGEGAAPAPLPGGAKLILVDISEQRMYVYQDGALVQTFIASTGEPGRDTRQGTFSVLNKIPNAYGSTWNIWMENWLGIYWAGSLQNGIHALPILPSGARLWDGYLGTRISYGCVVLSVADSQWLFAWAEVGTPVVIQY